MKAANMYRPSLTFSYCCHSIIDESVCVAASAIDCPAEAFLDAKYVLCQEESDRLRDAVSRALPVYLGLDCI